MSMTRSLPELGRSIRGEWLLDWSKLTVNHGSYGATPRAVLAAQDDWRRQLEAQPSLFMRHVLPGALREAADRLARFIGADGRDVVFTDNATAGCNAVMRSLDFRPGDEIVILEHAYGAVRNTAHYVAERTGARIVEAPMAFPQPTEDQIVSSLAAALTDRTRLAVLDHITSASALVLPIARLVAACRDAGVPVLVDGAHGPGHVALDLKSLNADWYVGNCHKWLMAPKGCAFLWTRPDRQSLIHPLTISHGFRQGYLQEFDWTGTRDPSAYLAVTAAIDFHDHLGGAGLRARNAALARRAAEILSDTLKTDIAAGPELCGAMTLVRLPEPGNASADRIVKLRNQLQAHQCDAPISPIAGSLWLRISAQAYNDEADYVRLAGIVLDAIRAVDE
jgi:isopenicillin-N epimerase